MFSQQFTSCKKYRKLSFDLFDTKQREDESLRAYLKRFNLAKLDVPDASEDTLMNALITGIREGPFFQNLIIHVPCSFGEVLDRAESYINLEETLRIK
jgi:Retrotransposon gag protein